MAPENQELNFEGIERQPLRTFTEKAYLDYSMYVILDRALPALGDGLKPVQRRIVYAMSELGLSAVSKHKKSARTVGDVLGKFHPHGDTACYEAMVLMAQPFAYRYPLVDGQGNWGSQDDPKSFAAMRYTEAKLTKYAEVLLGELSDGTVDWTANFDGTLQEPVILPARLPNLLLNGTSGIAVGMATDIPPHNLRELAAAAVHLLEDPEATLAALMKRVLGPDLPTGAEIISPRADLKQFYEKGVGTFKARATWETEDGNIVVTAFPYQVSPSRVQEQIAEQMRAKKLPMVEDEPKPVLMKRFKLSDEQAEEILNTRLRHLAKLEEMKIREEQKTLSAEREELEALLKSKAKLKKLIAAEIRADAEKYGDERRTKIIEREAAQAIDETSLIPNEPVTVVLSTGGFVRSAKGHEVEPGALSYKGGDAFQALARGRSLQSAVFIDSTGRTYTLPAHSLPSARGHGEPLSGRLDPPDGAKFAGVMIGEPEELWLLASDAGYGFTARLKDLISDRRAGKTVLSVPENAQVLAPAPVPSADSLVAVVSSEGKLLAFPVGEVPEMPRGKGNKLYDIPGKKARARTELMTAAAVVPPNASLVLWSGETERVIEWRDLQAYVGERAQRGTVLKRGWPRNIDRMEARLPAARARL